MNIFALHTDPSLAAGYLCDQHVISQIKESTQILATVTGRDVCKPTHANHPCTRWVLDNFANQEWLVAHAISLCTEYSRRFGRHHAYEKALLEIHEDWKDHVHSSVLEPFVQCVPEEFLQPEGFDEAVVAYRDYYRWKARHGFKRPMRYTKSKPPEWLTQGGFENRFVLK